MVLIGTARTLLNGCHTKSIAAQSLNTCLEYTFVAEGEAVGELLEELVARVLGAHHPLAHRQRLSPADGSGLKGQTPLELNTISRKQYSTDLLCLPTSTIVVHNTSLSDGFTKTWYSVSSE
jgi:hypothetical protein